MTKLAINGGTPIRTKLFPAYNNIGEEEKKAVLKVLDSGNLSQFLGAWHPDFYGGPTVRQFEEDWGTSFGVKFSISVNSSYIFSSSCLPILNMKISVRVNLTCIGIDL